MGHRAFLFLLALLSMVPIMLLYPYVEPWDNPAGYSDWNAGPDVAVVRGPMDGGRHGRGLTSEDLDRVVTVRMETYRAKLADLTLNLKFQLMFTVFALIVLFQQGKTRHAPMKIPILDVDVPALWLHLCAIFGLLWLWLQFGYLLDRIIDDRLVLYRIIAAGEAVGPSSVLSLRGALGDAGLADAWFVTFRPEHSNLPGAAGAFITVPLSLCAVFFGLGHACVYGLALELKERFQGWYGWHLILALVSTLLITGSHVMFYLHGNPNWVHSITGFATIVFTALVLFMRKPVPPAPAPVAVD
jgi:hypothetical protein